MVLGRGEKRMSLDNICETWSGCSHTFRNRQDHGPDYPRRMSDTPVSLNRRTEERYIKNYSVIIERFVMSGDRTWSFGP